jgi:hypothetical protein
MNAHKELAQGIARINSAMDGRAHKSQMTLREKLADWITGGKYSHARFAQERLDNHFAPLAWKYEDALNAIAAMQTPSANATVRRMARTAQEALK